MEEQARRKQILVSGCARGIGEAVVRRFLDEGYAVTGMSRTDPETVYAKYDHHPCFAYVQGDVASREAREAFVLRAIARGQIDGLVNVAGVAPRVRADLLDMTEESYDYVMDINTKGTLFLTQAVAREMVRNPLVDVVRGYLCNISSMSAYTTSTNRGEYCISKAGVSMITSLFAARLAEYSIPVNEVRPGIIETDMIGPVKAKYDALIEEGLLPLRRMGKPSDIADAVYALCSGALPYVTGQSLDVDGGFHLRRL